MTTSRPVTGRTLLPVFLLEAARRPVVVRRIAAARAVEGGDVLERDQDVAVELDVGHILDIAGRGQDALLVLAAGECDGDLLSLVLVRVVLHRSKASGKPLSSNVSLAVFAAESGGGVVSVSVYIKETCWTVQGSSKPRHMPRIRWERERGRPQANLPRFVHSKTPS